VRDAVETVEYFHAPCVLTVFAFHGLRLAGYKQCWRWPLGAGALLGPGVLVIPGTTQGASVRRSRWNEAVKLCSFTTLLPKNIPLTFQCGSLLQCCVPGRLPPRLLARFAAGGGSMSPGKPSPPVAACTVTRRAIQHAHAAPCFGQRPVPVHAYNKDAAGTRTHPRRICWLS
jgi:hypothetical protein